MPESIIQAAPGAFPAFLALIGDQAWRSRQRDLAQRSRTGRHQGRAALVRHAVEIALARLTGPAAPAKAGPAERAVLALAEEAVRLADSLPPASRARLCDRLAEALTGTGTLVPLFHLLRTAVRARAKGFDVDFDGLSGDAPYDLLIRRDGAEAEIACEVISAEEGRHVHRGDWYALVDRLDPDLQRWLASHPGRYLLKVTLPDGLAGADRTADLHARILAMLQGEARHKADQGAVLKLDPLMLAGSLALDAPGGLQASLRAQFGPEAHLAMTGAADGGSVFVMAARAGRENEIAQAATRRLAQAASRLDGRRPGILAAFIEDLDRAEWRSLRDSLELEGAVRRFLTTAKAQSVVAVSCASRMELLGMAPPDAAAAGELRYRNPAHPEGRNVALGPVIESAA